ncbi:MULTISPECIES: quinoprotein relay system zinc metallohydrolase 1 [unclassified Halomonas]|uniref:quinoprotein relay system zinc metallohydrolase 1 n=1 Tax=unclassified Halomonas TaxID=2609666 RepID=UPI000990414C|nr:MULTISPECIES: quinoprotein relay system zinc metallohydrolase 1 [unclassified Halomonas]AQU83984.1 MBL fold metallo-hydrolase [Halomonas sp. 'Soap Lake \
MKACFLAALSTLLSMPLAASESVMFCERPLMAQQVAENTWMVEGLKEELSSSNCGHIGNQAFIVTPNGVILIDSGSSPAFGKALKTLIAQHTSQPVRWVLNTHHHPDHFFGNAAFDEAQHLTLASTRTLMSRDREALIDNVERLTGRTLERTHIALPDVVEAGELMLESYPLTLFALGGHSGGDLVIMDYSTGVLFLGDMGFYQRAAATAHTPGLHQWQEELNELRTLDAKIAVPGHGPSAHPDTIIDQTANYLAWLDQHLSEVASEGLGANHALAVEIPDTFSTLALAEYELTRSIMQLYPRYEARLLWDTPP